MDIAQPTSRRRFDLSIRATVAVVTLALAGGFAAGRLSYHPPTPPKIPLRVPSYSPDMTTAEFVAAVKQAGLVPVVEMRPCSNGARPGHILAVGGPQRPPTRNWIEKGDKMWIVAC